MFAHKDNIILQNNAALLSPKVISEECDMRSKVALRSVVEETNTVKALPLGQWWSMPTRVGHHRLLTAIFAGSSPVCGLNGVRGSPR